MALVTKLGKPKPKAVSDPTLDNLSLDPEPNVPPTTMNRFSWLIYGAKGIGKTSLACKFDNPILLALEIGYKGIKGVNAKNVYNWKMFVKYVDLLVKDNDDSRTVIIDTVDLMYDYAYDHECQRLKIDSPTEENDFGATWRKIRKMFRTEIERLLALPGGVVFLSHDTEKEIATVTVDGMDKIDRVQPTTAKQGLQEIEGLMDVIGYYGYEKESRYLWIDGTQTRVGKCRPEDNFIQTDGTKVKRVDMGSSSAEAYLNLKNAFNNKQSPEKAVVKPKSTLKIRSLK